MTPIKYAAYLLWTIFALLVVFQIVAPVIWPGTTETYWWDLIVFALAFFFSMATTKRDPWDDLPAGDKARVASKIYRAIEDESIEKAAKTVSKRDIHDDAPMGKGK